MVTARLKFRDKVIEIINIEKCPGIKKITGLMFHSKDTKPRLFEFSRPTRTPIHSFFCPKFLAIWMNDNNIVEYKMIDKWKISIKPEKEFNKLLEIPVNKTYGKIIELFLDGERKI